MKIIHIADLHIQTARKGEYQQIFDLLIDAVEEHRPQAVVIAGDVFDNKITVRPDEIDLFCYLAKCIMDLRVHLVIIPGNHDCNMNDAAVTDLLTPIVKESLQDNQKYAEYVHFWTRTGTYEALGMDWSVYSPIDQLTPEARALGTRIHIALVHETVRSCEIQTGAIWEEETRLSVDTLAGYDIVMMGDVHRMQFMRPHIAYSGSLVQQNIGEAPDDHGYILWDVEARRGQFHEIPNPLGVMLKLRFENDRLLNRYEAVRRVKRCDVFYKNCTREYVAKISTYVRERWGINITRFREVDPRLERVLTDAAEGRSALEHWLDAQKIPEAQRARIRACDLRYNSAVASPVGHTFQLLYLEWRNMLCYGGDHTNHIDFSRFRRGDRVGIMGANRSGKSSILDIMCYILYDVPLRGMVADILNSGSDAYACRAMFESNGDTYVVSKRRDKHRNTKLAVTCNGVTVTKATSAKTYEWLQTLVGRYTDFTNITCQLQDHALFTSLAYKDQVAYMYNVLGLDVIPELITRVRADRSELRARERHLPRPRGAAPPVRPDVELPENVDERLAALNQRVGRVRYAEVPEVPRSPDMAELPELRFEVDRLRAYPEVQGEVEDDANVHDCAAALAVIAAELARLPEPEPAAIAELESQLRTVQAVPEAAAVPLPEVTAEALARLSEQELPAHQPEVEVPEAPAVHLATDTLDGLLRELELIPDGSARIAEIDQALNRLPAAQRGDPVALARQLERLPADPELPDLPEEPPQVELPDAEFEVQRLRVELAVRTSGDAAWFQFDQACAACRSNSDSLAPDRRAADVARIAAELARAEAAVRYTRWQDARARYDVAVQARDHNQRRRVANLEIETQIQAAEAFELTRERVDKIASGQRRDELQRRVAGLRYACYAAARAHNLAVRQQRDAAALARSQLAYMRWREYCAATEHNAEIMRRIGAARASELKQRESQLRSEHDRYMRARGHERWKLQCRIDAAEASLAWCNYREQRDTLAEIAKVREAVAWREHQSYREQVDALRQQIADLDLYLQALDLTDGYPRIMIRNSVARLRESVAETVALVTTDKVTISEEFEIRINDISVNLASGFQKMIANLALRHAMLRCAQVPHQKMTLIVDEGLLGSCDPEHMHQVVRTLLPALGVRLFMITHHEELRASMTHIIPLGRPGEARVNYGEARK